MMSEAISFLPWWISLPLLAGGCILTLIVGFAAFSALTIVAERAWYCAWHLVDSMTALFVHVTISALAGCVALLQMLVNLLLWPLTILWEHTAARAQNALALKAEAFRQRQQLWHHWRREFRDQFPTFREFVDAFEGGGKRREEPRFQDAPHTDGREQGRRDQDQPRPPPDPQSVAFIAACRLLGLPESGDFTPNDLTVRYRALISKAHPDRPVHSGAATSINVARDLIKQRKGWA